MPCLAALLQLRQPTLLFEPSPESGVASVGNVIVRR